MSTIKFVELTDKFKSEFDYYSKLVVIKNAKREDVRHYKLNDTCVNDENVINQKIKRMIDAHWWSFNFRYESLCIGNGENAKVLTCAPHKFSHINTEVDSLKPFIFTYENDDGDIEIHVEMNYSFEVQ